MRRHVLLIFLRCFLFTPTILRSTAYLFTRSRCVAFTKTIFARHAKSGERQREEANAANVLLRPIAPPSREIEVAGPSVSRFVPVHYFHYIFIIFFAFAFDTFDISFHYFLRAYHCLAH